MSVDLFHTTLAEAVSMILRWNDGHWFIIINDKMWVEPRQKLFLTCAQWGGTAKFHDFGL